MIQQKKSTDRAIYQRALKAVENGDMTMKPVVEWYNRGKKPKFEGTAAHLKARELIIDLCKSMRQDEICKRYGLYHSFIYRLKTKDFQRVPEERCREFINQYEG